MFHTIICFFLATASVFGPEFIIHAYDSLEERKTMTRVLITGATGFVGSHILEAVSAAPGLEAIAACRRPEKLLPGLAHEVRVGDLRDADYRARLVKNVDVLCHAAAWTSAWGHADLSETHFLDPSLVLLDQAVAEGLKRVVFLSSTSVAAPKHSADPMHSANPDHL
ncbi:MAG TPA: NAD-dependent epimerase/dehydratase family protein, partial [Aliiroseovarius sp.]|nr:NAD-dependent epimerase/dehydratase family protein [Aliiroseovarius sp.]